MCASTYGLSLQHTSPRTMKASTHQPTTFSAAQIMHVPICCPPCPPLSTAALCVRETASMDLSLTSPSLSPAPLHHTTPVRTHERRDESEGGGVLAPLLLLSATPLPSGEQHHSGAGVVMSPGGGGWRRIARHLLLLQAFMAQVGMHKSNPKKRGQFRNGQHRRAVGSCTTSLVPLSWLSPVPEMPASKPRLFVLPSVCLFASDRQHQNSIARHLLLLQAFMAQVCV